MSDSTAAELLAAAGPTMTVPVVAKVFGISRATAYELAATGELGGVRVLKLGKRLVVPTADVRRALGVDTAA